MNEDQFKLPEHAEGMQPFAAPEGYFDSFPNRMAYRTEVKKDAKRNFDIEFLFRPVAITTIVLFVIGTVVLTFQGSETVNTENNASGETLLSYVEQEGILDELSEDELVEHFFEEGVTSVENDEDSLSIEITEELVNDDFIDFETYDEL
jgi:hypothetical protein